MTLRELEVFRAVIMGGTVTEAANLLNVSQPAVSKTLRSMEDRLGTRLFRRERGRLVSTPEALRLYPEVEKLFGMFESVQKFARDLRDTRSGLLTLASTPTLSYAFVSEAISRFRKGRPAVRVRLQIATTREIVELAEKSEIDLGVIHAPTESPSLDVRKLFDAEMICVMPAGHPLADRPFVGPIEMSRYPLIANTTNTIAPRADEAFRSMGVERNVAISANHTLAAYALVEAGAGLALVDPWIRADLFPNLVRKPFRPSIRISPRVVRSRTTSASRLMLRFVDVLDEVVRGEGTSSSIHSTS